MVKRRFGNYREDSHKINRLVFDSRKKEKEKKKEIRLYDAANISIIHVAEVKLWADVFMFVLR